MSDIADRYRRLSDAFAARIAAVPHDRWDAPTPCEDWSVLALVDHVVQAQSMFRKLVGREPAQTPEVSADPAGAWEAARSAVQVDLEDPARAATEFDGLTGRQSFAQAVDRFLVVDLVVHGWDLARATGQDEEIPAEDLAHVWEQVAVLDDAIRSSGAFGAQVEPPPGAGEQERLLAFLGRRP